MPDKILQYDVMAKLGEGAKSSIYAVQDPGTRKTYALKHVIRDESKDIRFVEQMETEFEISRQFNHPNLRKTYELKISKTLLMKVTEAYMLMELFDGKALDERPPSSVPEVIEIFLQVAAGLKAMHELGFVHCDLKPNNILRNSVGHVKVIDYGQSCKIGTVKERIQGTPDYIAPEQVDRRPLSVQTDVYNFGATMYWALTGKNIPTLYTVKKKGEHSFLLDNRIDSPIDLNPQVPESLSKLVMECVSTRVSKRPADMDDVTTRLELAKHIMAKQAGQLAAGRASDIDLGDSVSGDTVVEPEKKKKA
jgi:serine/threonine-protein kinase